MAINFPSNPQIGDITTQGNRTWQWSGEFWRSITTTIGYTGSQGVQGDLGYTGSQGDLGYTGSGTGYLVSNTAPESAQVGDRWYDSADGIEYTYIFDGDDYFWVEVGTVSSGAGLAGNVSVGTDSNNTVIFNAKVSSDLVPSSNITYDLGSDNLRWKDLYLSGNTIYLGAAQISSNESGGLILPANTNIGTGGAILPSVGGFGFRNQIINGNFDIWQRGTSFTASNTTNFYTADRWRFEGFPFTGSLARQVWPELAEGFFGAFYYCRWVHTSTVAASQYSEFSQRIETTNKNKFYNKQISVTMWLRSVSGTIPDLALSLRFGSQSQFVGEVTNAWSKKTFLFVDSSPGSSYQTLAIRLNAGYAMSNGLDIAQVQVEEGSVPTEFEIRPISIESEMCYRYYYLMTSAGTNGFISFAPGTGFSGSIADFVVRTPVPMRVNVGVSLSARSTFYVDTGNPGTTLTAIDASNFAITLRLNAGTQGDAYKLRANSSTAAFIAFDAEL